MCGVPVQLHYLLQLIIVNSVFCNICFLNFSGSYNTKDAATCNHTVAEWISVLLLTFWSGLLYTPELNIEIYIC